MPLTGYRLAWLQKAARTGAVPTDHYGSCTAALAAANWLIDRGLMWMDLVDSYRITDAGRSVLQQQLMEKSSG